MKKLAALAITLSLMALGIAPQNTFADTTTTRWGMTKPDVGSTNWGPKINSNYDIIDNAAGVGITNTFTQPNYFTGVVVIGGTTYSGSGDFELRKDQNTDTIFRITNVNNNASAGTELLLTANGATSGDPFLGFVTNAQSWAIGVDSSDTSKFKISNSASLGTNNIFTLDSSSSVIGVPIYFPDGSASFPSMAFSTNRQTGFYRNGQNGIGMSNNGSLKFSLEPSGIYLSNDILSNTPGAFNLGGSSFYFGKLYIKDSIVGTTTIGVTANSSSVAIFASTGVAIKGTTTNDNAAAGWVGQTISSSAAGAPFQGTAVTGDLVSLSLTAGDWLVSAAMETDNNPGAIFTGPVRIGISVTSGNSEAGLVEGESQFLFIAPTTGASIISSMSIPSYRMSFASTTSVYLKYRSSYTSGPPNAYGTLRAVRIR